jgi:hypothetical protein
MPVCCHMLSPDALLFFLFSYGNVIVFLLKLFPLFSKLNIMDNMVPISLSLNFKYLKFLKRTLTMAC